MRLFLIFALICSTGFARLGETTMQLIERFGPPKFTLDEQTVAQGKIIKIGDRMQFSQDDWQISCVVIEGRCAKVTYSKPGDWTDAQIETVLTSNAQGTRWTNVTKPGLEKMVREWRRTDGATAEWKIGTMTVTHPAFELSKKKAIDQAKASGSKTPKI